MFLCNKFHAYAPRRSILSSFFSLIFLFISHYVIICHYYDLVSCKFLFVNHRSATTEASNRLFRFCIVVVVLSLYSAFQQSMLSHSKYYRSIKYLFPSTNVIILSMQPKAFILSSLKQRHKSSWTIEIETMFKIFFTAKYCLDFYCPIVDSGPSNFIQQNHKFGDKNLNLLISVYKN